MQVIEAALIEDDRLDQVDADTEGRGVPHRLPAVLRGGQHDVQIWVRLTVGKQLSSKSFVDGGDSNN